MLMPIKLLHVQMLMVPLKKREHTQRQVGETALNDRSSRSHQIIKLTIQSTQCENSDCVRSYVASLNFVDLGGSERASQTHDDGARLREGCHINLSLMTLTTVIRKLSVGAKRCGHIRYRDSKLTRILQHSLGGNARTAIICTLSPTLSHVEQTRNTLFFATRAKEVTNNAQVNMGCCALGRFDNQVASLPFFCGSPPSRVSNPIVQDEHFIIGRFSPISPVSASPT